MLWKLKLISLSSGSLLPLIFSSEHRYHFQFRPGNAVANKRLPFTDTPFLFPPGSLRWLGFSVISFYMVEQVKEWQRLRFPRLISASRMGFWPCCSSQRSQTRRLNFTWHGAVHVQHRISFSLQSEPIPGLTRYRNRQVSDKAGFVRFG